MISFTDAQMEGSTDKKFQDQYNYLIQLLSTYLTRGTISSINGENYINLKDGTFKLALRDGTEYVKQVGNGIEVKGNITITGGNAATIDYAEDYADGILESFIDDIYDGDISDLQEQIDGKIVTWFYPYEPSLINIPASDWTTDAVKDTHLGDLFFDTVTGYAYRFKVDTGVYSWEWVQDTDIQQALSDASNAQDTADGKRRVFVTTPFPPYDVGDLWAGGSAGDLKRCKTAKDESGEYSADDWELATEYTKGADWTSNLINIPGTLGTPTGAGLFLSSTHLGYFDSPNWKTYMDNSGNFYLGGTLGKLQWVAATDSLVITGKITIEAESSGISNFSDAGALATQSDVDFSTQVSGAEKPEDNATVGADWEQNLTSIPSTLESPLSSDDNGLHLTGTYVGYYSHPNWTVYIKNDGTFLFQKDANSYLKWDGTTFELKGKVVVTGGDATKTFTSEPTTPYKVGDLWVEGSTGDIKRCTTAKESGAYEAGHWEQASKYTDDTLANTKRRHFTAEPTTPYNVGDLWTDGSVLKRCKTERLTGAYASGDWEAAVGYTDDTTVNALVLSLGDLAYEDLVESAKLGDTIIEGGYIKTELLDVGDIISTGSIIVVGSNISDLTNDSGFTDDTVANTKIATFAQGTVPTAISAGDLWFDTSDGNKCYKATAIGDDEIKAGEWVLYQDLNKTTTFAQDSIPTSTAVGDLWIDTNDDNKLYRAYSIGADEIKSGEWVLLRDDGIAEAIQAASDAQDAADDAQGDATDALNALSDIASDGKITPVEKLDAKQKWDAIVVEGTATTGTIPAQAILFGVATTTFDSAYSALNTYLNTTLTVFANMSATTDVVRATWDTNWKTYYDARTKILNAIATKAKDLADAAQDDVDQLIEDLGDLAYEDLVESAKLGTTVISGGLIIADLLSADNVVTGRLQNIAGDTYFDLDDGEIQLSTTIDGETFSLVINPTVGFDIDWADRKIYAPSKYPIKTQGEMSSGQCILGTGSTVVKFKNQLSDIPDAILITPINTTTTIVTAETSGITQTQFTARASSGCSAFYWAIVNSKLYLYNLDEIVTFVEGYSRGQGSVDKATYNYLLISATEDSGTFDSIRSFVTDGTIDLTDYNTLYIDWENIGTADANNASFLAVDTTGKTTDMDDYDARIAKTNTFTRTVEELDVSTLSGTHYIKILGRAQTPSIVSTIKVHRLYLV